MILFYWLTLFCTTSLFAEISIKLPREYYTPGDLDGFSLAPSNPIISLEAEKKSPSAAMALEVEAINRRAFVHLRRREAIPVDDENFQLTQDARVYSPSRGMAVIHAADHFSMLLFPKTSIEAKKNQERWLFTVHEEQGNLRISTLQDGLILKFEAVQSSELWSSLDLYIAPGSDILIHKQPSLLQTWLIRGQAHLIFSKKFGLHSQRADSLLSELQNAQIHDLEPARKQVDLFSGQELQLGVESELTIKITLPSPQLWQDKLLKSSPLLAENIQNGKRSIQKVQNIRVKVLENWLKDQSIDATTIPSLLQQQRWEEAYYLLQKAKASQKEGLSPTMQTQEMLCLLRLQQDQRLKTYSTADALLQTEKLRILLRRHAANEIIEKTFERDSLSSVDSVYLMAIAHQQKKSWRIAADYWELWPGSDEDLTLERSRHEWLENLDQEKPWSWQAQMSLGQDSNPLHIPPKTAAAPEYGHRSNNVFRTRQKLQYLFDRQNTFSVRGEMLLDAQFYQSVSLASLNRLDPGFALDLSFNTKDLSQFINIKIIASRLSLNMNAVLDKIAYELRWQNIALLLQPVFTWTQEQFLDPNPLLIIAFDPLSGENISPMDRSVRRNRLSLGLEWLPARSDFEFYLQTWDYRYDGARPDNRLRYGIKLGAQIANWQNLKLRGELHQRQDMFQGPIHRASQQNTQVSLALSYLWTTRWQPSLRLEREQQSSGLITAAWVENRSLLGLEGRW